MAQGIVEKFDEKRGFGFIIADGGGSVFIHRREFWMKGYRTLKPGQQLTFDIVDGPKGPEARNINLVGPAVVTLQSLDGNEQEGYVAWFDEKRGFGFIFVEGFGDVFVHCSKVEEGSCLKEGQRVTFDAFQSEKGPQARNVRVIA